MENAQESPQKSNHARWRGFTIVWVCTLGILGSAALVSPLLAVAPQPDLHVSKNPGTGFKGDNVYNSNSAGQSLNHRTRGRSVNTFIRIDVDGPPSTVEITGTPGNGKFRTRYFVDGANQTSAITKGTFDPAVPPTVVIKQRVKPTRKLRGKSARKTFRITGSQSGRLDRVRITIRKK